MQTNQIMSPFNIMMQRPKTINTYIQRSFHKIKIPSYAKPSISCFNHLNYEISPRGSTEIQKRHHKRSILFSSLFNSNLVLILTVNIIRILYFHVIGTSKRIKRETCKIGNLHSRLNDQEFILIQQR